MKSSERWHTAAQQGPVFLIHPGGHVETILDDTDFKFEAHVDPGAKSSILHAIAHVTEQGQDGSYTFESFSGLSVHAHRKRKDSMLSP